MMNEDARKRLEELREKNAKREAAYADEADAHELKELELVEEYSQKLGRRGRDFEIVHPRAEGPIVLRRGEETLHKAYISKEPRTSEDTFRYVEPCVVYPAREAWLKMVADRPQITYRCANAMLTMHGAKEEGDRGKF